jgi:hypothetical protein
MNLPNLRWCNQKLIQLFVINQERVMNHTFTELRRIFQKQKSEKSEFYFGKSEKSEKIKKSEKSEKKIKKS